MMKKRLSLSPPELLAAVLCVAYALVLGQIMLTGAGDLWELIIVPTMALLCLLMGARRTASVFQYIFAVLWLLICLLLLGILAICVGKDAPGFWQMIVWMVGSFLMALLHNFLAHHIRAREEE